MDIVLLEPEIPHNTGNIARTCALTGSALHLVRPLGFRLEDRYLKRAGLDYWDRVDVQVWDDLRSLQSQISGRVFHYATTHTGRCYAGVSYGMNDVLVLGKETAGLPAALLEANPDSLIRIPMRDFGRSLNLANAAAIILFEALRQNGFAGLE